MIKTIFRETSRAYEVVADETIYEYVHSEEEELDKHARFFIMLSSSYKERDFDEPCEAEGGRDIFMVFTKRKRYITVTEEALQTRLQKISELTALHKAPDHDGWSSRHTAFKLCFLKKFDMNKRIESHQITEFFDNLVFDAVIECDNDDHIQDLEPYVALFTNYFFNVAAKKPLSISQLLSPDGGLDEQIARSGKDYKMDYISYHAGSLFVKINWICPKRDKLIDRLMSSLHENTIILRSLNASGRASYYKKPFLARHRAERQKLREILGEKLTGLPGDEFEKYKILCKTVDQFDEIAERQTIDTLSTLILISRVRRYVLPFIAPSCGQLALSCEELME